MNERLQQLASKAGHYEFNKWDYFDINKFAELIVRDCVYMAKGYECALNRDNQLSSAMLEHFGVKE